MVKNWPRTVEVQLNSFEIGADLFTTECLGLGDSDMLQGMMKAELGTMQKSIDEVARQVIAGLEAVLEMKSPYPPECCIKQLGTALGAALTNYRPQVSWMRSCKDSEKTAHYNLLLRACC